MSFSAECPFCQILLQNVPRHYAGRSMECPRCRSYFTLSPLLGRPRPKPVEAAATVPVAATAAAIDEPSPGAVEAHSETGTAEAAADTADAPPVPAAPRKRPANFPAVLSFLCGSLALFALSAPFAVRAVVPLASVGVAVGLLGGAWAVWTAAGARLAALGLGVSLPTLVAGLLLPAPVAAPAREAPAPGDSPPLVVHLGQRTGRALVPREGDWADASKDAAQQGDLRVRVQSADVKRVELGQAKGPPLTKEKYLVIRLRLSNAGTNRIIDYTGWGVTGPEPDAAARLTDSQGKAYRPRLFPDSLKVSGQVRQAAFAPGKWVDDLLVFEAPPADTKFVRLELPCAALGGKGMINLEIPRRMIKLR